MLEVSDAYRSAAASSGLLTASQLRARPEVQRNTELLQKNKLALRDIVGMNGKYKASINEIYRDQLRLRRMTVTSRGLDKFGREISDITVPKDVPRELDTINNRLKYARTLTASASQQMVNWGKNTQWAGRQLTVGFTYPMALFAAGTAKMAYDIDKQLTRITKVYDTTLGSESLAIERATEAQNLRADSYSLAAEMARKYGAAAKDVLGVEADLAATGLNGGRLFDATRETVRIATLGDLDFDKATEMTISLQTAFRDTIKTSEDLTDAFNFMNAVENATSLSIQDIAEATPRAASALAGLGVTVQQMTVMMSAMRSAGIDAAEGANALKSVSTRIINPGVLAGAQPFFEGIVDLSKISKQSQGNLYTFVQLLGEATKSMDNYQRQQGFAKLFGAYQYNRGAAIIKNMTDAMHNLNDETNQTARAMKTATMSSAELAAIADNEVSKKMNSASGQFDAAWNSMLVTAAKIGESFLPIVTDILKTFDLVTNAGMHFFGMFPDWGKKMLGTIAILAALAGPLVMMSGLFVNMFGQVAKLVSIGPKFAILNRAQMAAEIQANAASKAYLNEAQAVSMLTDELVALAAAQGYSTAVGQIAMAGAPGSRSAAYSTRDDIVLPPGYSHRDDSRGRRTYLDPAGKAVKGDTIPAVRQWRKEQELIEKSTSGAVRNVRQASIAAGAMHNDSEKIAKSWSATKVSGGLFAASLIGTMVPGVEKVSGYLMTASMAIMGVSTAKDLFANSKAEKAAKASKLVTASTVAGNAALVTQATRWGKVGTVLGKVGKYAKSIFGKVGLIGRSATIIGAVVTGLTLVYKMSQKSSKQQQALNDSADSWAAALGGVAEKYHELNGLAEETNSNNLTASDIADKFKDDEKMKGIIEAFKAAREDADFAGIEGDDSEIGMKAMAEYIKMIDKTNLTARDAKVGLEAMFLAAGFSAETATKEAQKYFDLIGDKVSNKEYGVLWKQQIDELFMAGGDVDDRIDGMVKEFSDSMYKFSNALERGEFLNTFKNSFSQSFEDALAGAMDSGTQAALAGYGLDTAGEINNALDKYREYLSGDTSEQQHFADFGLDPSVDADVKKMETLEGLLNTIGNNPALSQVLVHEEQVVKALADQLKIKLDIYDLDHLQAALDGKDFTVTKKQLWERYHTAAKGVSKETKLLILNQQRVSAGLKETVHLSDGFKENTRGTEIAERRVAAAADHTNDILKARRGILDDFLNGSGALDALKGAWGAINSAVASEVQATLSAQQQAEMDAFDANTEAEQKGFENRAQHWQDYYDNLIDKTNDFYDKRIDRINALIDAETAANEERQRIFEAEAQRLQRLADMQNSNIDFNMALNEGKLDEAAKLMNDAVAKTAADQMDDEQARADAELDVRRASLEKQIELLEKQRDLKVKALEDARDAKDKAIKIAQDRADQEVAIDKAALEEKQANQSKYYEMALAELNAYIPTSQADLEAHIKELNKRYEKYGVKLETTASGWASFIAEQHNLQMAIAANNLKSDVNWAGAGYDAAQGMMDGMAAALGMNSGQFRKWLGVSMGKRPKDQTDTSSGAGGGPGTMGGPGRQDNHEGGLLGRGGSGRTGFSGAYSPHREVQVNAKVGEYMINDRAVRKYGVDFFDSVNDGEYGTGGPSGPGQMMGAFMGSALSDAVYAKMQKKVMKKYAREQMRNLFSGGTGQYNLPGVKPWVLEAANYLGGKFGINTILGVGERSTNSTSDHPKGLALDFMTGTSGGGVTKGNALSAEAIRLWRDLDATYLIWRARINSFDSRGWQPYHHPSGATDPTSMHMDHVHLSFSPTGDTGDLPSSAYNGASGYVPGTGGRHRPVNGGVITQGLHPTNAIDIGVKTGTPVYAVTDGYVTGSYDIPGYEPRQPDGGNGYKSYGRVITLDHGGYSTLYAHLSRRGVSEGMNVKGGSIIGYSGDTGNSSGDHLHFGAPGSNPYAFLREGGTLRYDNTHVIGHRNETMLSAPLTQAFKNGVKEFGKGGSGGDTYEVLVDMTGATIASDVDVEKAMDAWWDKKRKKTGIKRKVG